MDWSVRNRDLVAHHIIAKRANAATSFSCTTHMTQVSEAALQTIDVLSKQGYEFVTLEELFSNARRHAAGRTLLSARG